jgi:hypothetical protein
MADLTFYSSIRQGAALAITRTDVPPGPTDTAIPRVQLPVNLSYAAETALQGTAASTTLSLLGPGDIVGLDTRTIVRTFPPPNDNEAEAGFLVYVDFDQVDLPWRYTPATNVGTISPTPGQSNDQLRPWLTLVVLAEGADFNPTTDFRPAQGDEKLPQLTVALQFLPKFDQLWPWAHVQAQQLVSDAALPGAIGGPPGALVARLLSPRRLELNTAYTAFLVPTFQAGVLAGQGKNTATTTDGLASAWQDGGPDPVQLPVYYSWRFQTGSVSSFQQAISELSPLAQLPSTVGLRDMDVSSPGLIDASATGGSTPMSMGGALQTPEQAVPGDPQLNTDWVNALGALVDPAQQTTPVVVPPLYGHWYAVQDHLDYPKRVGAATNPPWFSLLNQDPRYRVAAGLGVEIVQRDQQALLAAAQEQESFLLNTVNRRRRVLQAGREIFTSLMNRHIVGTATTRANEAILLVTAFLHGKILSCTGVGPTIVPILTGSPFGGRLIPFRRPFRFGPFGPIIDTINSGGYLPTVTNPPPNTSTPDTTVGPGGVPGGLPDPGIATIINTMSSDQRLYWGVVIFWVARKLLSTQGGKYWWLLRRLLRLGLDLIQLASTQGATDLAVLQKLRDGTLLGQDILGMPQANNFLSATQNPEPVLSDPNTWPQTPRTPANGNDNPAAAAFRAAAAVLFDFVNGAPKTGRKIPALDIPGTVTCILNALAPAVTFTAYEKFIHKQITTRTIAWKGADPLEPILMPPVLAFPMWQRLSSISADWILPNVGDVPRNTVSLLETNQKFIESFMVGLNHQVNRELLWNGYPTDQRGTIFQQFWDSSGWTDGDESGNGLTDADFLDIAEVRGWGATSVLGSHTKRAKPAQLVLLVRGDVIKRYPNVIVYAAQVSSDPTKPLDDSKQRYPVFQAILTGDVAYYGFDLTLDEARGANGNPGYYFVLQEHPSEPKFVDPIPPPTILPNNLLPGDYAGLNSNTAPVTAAVLAAAAFDLPIRAAILGSELLPPSSP